MITRTDRHFWLAVFLLHLVGAITWIWLMPGGFRWSHPHFWANRALPAVVVLVAIYAAIATRQDNRAIAAAISVTAGWLSCAIVSRFVFSESGRLLWWFPLAVGGMVLLRLVRLVRNTSLSVNSSAIVLGILGAGIGTVMPVLERAPRPGTRPTDHPSVESSIAHTSSSERVVRLNGSLQITCADGTITLQRGRTVVWLQPLLSFGSRSPDGCWTIFAPRLFRRAPQRELLGVDRQPTSASFAYHDEETCDSTLSVRPLNNRVDGSCEVEATAELARTVFSHLNTFTEIELAGHRRLSLAFSPCPRERIEVRPEDYPCGRSGRSAYLDEASVFHVAEASSGEKGPFMELAHGALQRGEPLTIEAYDEEILICRITLDDWSAQADTTLSPTAGWGLPSNAIEFHREGDEPSSACEIAVTLAATSVGRGWDTVGHAAGAYRNRMRLELVQHENRDVQR